VNDEHNVIIPNRIGFRSNHSRNDDESTIIGVELRSRVKRDAAMERQLSHNPWCHIHRRQFLKE
jgi:hypothetical protein